MISPERMIIRDPAGAAIFDTSLPMMAVLGQHFGSWTNAPHASAASGFDDIHAQDHDAGAAPAGATHLFATIRPEAGTQWFEFSGAAELFSATYRASSAVPRVMVVYHQIAPKIVAGRIVLRERWWVHGPGPAGTQLAGWGGGTLIARTWNYDIRAVAFVGGS